MSQKAKITKVKHSGVSVYLGTDKFGNPKWTKDADTIMNYFCDGFRHRFNQFRALRSKHSEKVVDEGTGEVTYIDHPLGGDAVQEPPPIPEYRNLGWTISLPSTMLAYAKQVEKQGWSTSMKTIKTFWTKHPNGPGKDSVPQKPGFRSRKQDQIFRYSEHKSSKVSNGVSNIRITVQIPKKFVKPGEVGCTFYLDIQVRHSGELQNHSSFHLNWTQKTVSFTSTVPEVTREKTGRDVGVDMGVTHTLSTSYGEFMDIPRESLTKRKHYVNLQRSLSRKDHMSGKKVSPSNRRAKVHAKMANIRKKEARTRDLWMHTATRQLVDKYDRIAIEALNIKGMTSAGKKKSKKSLNRSILESNWGTFYEYLEYKSKAAGGEVKKIDPAYTSQMCYNCKHVDRENRTTQDKFVCVKCGHSDNADINAAKNILVKAAFK